MSQHKNKKIVFQKSLSANDAGKTGSHQAGILIPKGEIELLSFLPKLDASIKNPDIWLICIDEQKITHKFRFVYYNNKLHDPKGTRNEYRITYMTSWLKNNNANAGDLFEISRDDGTETFTIKILKQKITESTLEIPINNRLKLRGWRRVH